MSHSTDLSNPSKMGEFRSPDERTHLKRSDTSCVEDSASSSDTLPNGTVFVTSEESKALKLQKELEKAQKQLESYREQEAHRKQAELSELERLQERLKETEQKAEFYQERLEQEKKERSVRQAIRNAGGSDRIDVISRLIDLDALEYDEKGDLLGLSEQIAHARACAPELFGARTSAHFDTASVHKSSDKTHARTSQDKDEELAQRTVERYLQSLQDNLSAIGVNSRT